MVYTIENPNGFHYLTIIKGNSAIWPERTYFFADGEMAEALNEEFTFVFIRK